MKHFIEKKKFWNVLEHLRELLNHVAWSGILRKVFMHLFQISGTKSENVHREFLEKKT